VAGRTSVTFEVRDTGIEIPEHARAHVFDPGAQPGEVRRATEGTGLSLAIAKKLVEMMGGKIEVTSPAGRGCSFWFTVVFESVERISERRGETREAMPEPGSSAIAIQTESVATLSTAPETAKKRGHERRNEPRHGINYPTLLRSENAGIASVRILDVSTSGLRVATV
jgi:Histidine kinase-, DNA gyrase B-, and HSP90-like ATPase